MTTPAASGEALGPLLRRLRHGSNLTMEELAQLSGVSARAISNIERGSSLGPQQRTIEAIADGLGLKAQDREAVVVAARLGRRRIVNPERRLPAPARQAANLAAGRRDLRQGSPSTSTGRSQTDDSAVVAGGHSGLRPSPTAVQVAASSTAESGAGPFSVEMPGWGEDPLTSLTQSGGVVLRGRLPELERLGQVLTRTAAAGRGAAILLAGEPGIGKTALLRVLQRWALDQQFAVGFSKADEVSQIAPGAPVLQALHTGPNPALTEDEFRSLASLYDRPLWLVEAIADLLERRSQRAPVLIVVDDLQWADRLSRFALRTLMVRLVDSPIAWAVSARGRPEDAFMDFDFVGHVEGVDAEVMDLHPLTEADVLAVAEDVLRAPPKGRELDWLAMVGGNPFLAVAMAEGIALERRRGGSGGDLPEAFGATIGSRTRLLDDDTRAVLHLAAVWGRRLDMSDAAQMLDRTAHELPRSISQAVALGLITDSHDPIEFRHDLVREVLYRRLSEADRTRLHAICAAHLVSIGRSALEAAPHARLAAQRGDPRAVRILRRAALECIDSMPRTAADLMMEAFGGLSQQDPEWFALGGQCAELLIQAQHGADAIDVIDRLLVGTDQADQRARLQVLAARALWLMGSAEEMASRVNGELSTSLVTGALRSRLEASRSLALSRVGTGHEASLAAQGALDMGRELRDRDTQRLALQSLGEVATNEGRHLRAYEVFHDLRTTFGPGSLADEITSLQFIDRFDDAQVLLSQASRGRGQRSTAELPALVRAQLWQDFKLAQ
ncbi:MAG: AAA family ATPase, partial [Nakamurella sp.]